MLLENINPKELISTKNYKNFPCTHRQWLSDSHCKYIHGYSRSFYFEFAANSLSKEGWVVDFGGLKDVKEWLDYMFDHTFLASEDDPAFDTFVELDKTGVVQLRVLPNVGMEGTAVFVYAKVNKMIREKTNNRAWLKRIRVIENEKNSAVYEPENPLAD